MYLDININLNIFRGGSEDCAANVPEWSNIGNFQVRREQRNGYHTCSIHGRIGADVLKPEEVKWITNIIKFF